MNLIGLVSCVAALMEHVTASRGSLAQRTCVPASATTPMLMLLFLLLGSSHAATPSPASGTKAFPAALANGASPRLPQQHEVRPPPYLPSKGTDSPWEPHYREQYIDPAGSSQQGHGQLPVEIVPPSAAPTTPPPLSPLPPPEPWLQHLVQGQEAAMDLYRSQYMTGWTPSGGRDGEGPGSSHGAAGHPNKDSSSGIKSLAPTVPKSQPAGAFHHEDNQQAQRFSGKGNPSLTCEPWL